MLELSKTPEMNIKQMSLNIMRDVAARCGQTRKFLVRMMPWWP
jgi:hypothetical protein